MSDISEVKITGSMISIGFSLPYLALIAAIVVGTICIDAVLNIVRSAIFFVAVSFLHSSFFSSFIASIPSGVAAFPSPNILAVMLRVIAEKAEEVLFIPLKISPRMGESNDDILSVSPDFFAIFIIPPQNAIIPRRDKKSDTASSQEVTIDDDKSDILPVNTAQSKDIAEKITIKNLIKTTAFIKSILKNKNSRTKKATAKMQPLKSVKEVNSYNIVA